LHVAARDCTDDTTTNARTGVNPDPDGAGIDTNTCVPRFGVARDITVFHLPASRTCTTSRDGDDDDDVDVDVTSTFPLNNTHTPDGVFRNAGAGNDDADTTGGAADSTAAATSSATTAALT
jgi:hypothetical protein